ncbi:hypothetical protein HYW30_00570 [Candidatus Azambacteria bacterium]|nr:hypothetical protein [Candidatus Azambacteria bacterium]
MKESNELDWSGVERALEEGTLSGYKIAILETEKLFRDLLRRYPFLGKTVEERFGRLERRLDLPPRFGWARRMLGKILEEPGFDMSREETKDVISQYWQAIQRLEKWEREELSWKDRIRSKAVTALPWRNLFFVLAGLWVLLGFARIPLALTFFHFLFWVLTGIMGVVILGWLISLVKERYQKRAEEESAEEPLP